MVVLDDDISRMSGRRWTVGGGAWRRSSWCLVCNVQKRKKVKKEEHHSLVKNISIIMGQHISFRLKVPIIVKIKSTHLSHHPPSQEYSVLSIYPHHIQT